MQQINYPQQQYHPPIAPLPQQIWKEVPPAWVAYLIGFSGVGAALALTFGVLWLFVVGAFSTALGLLIMFRDERRAVQGRS